MTESSFHSGTGQKLADGTVIAAGICSLFSTIVSILYVLLSNEHCCLVANMFSQCHMASNVKTTSHPLCERSLIRGMQKELQETSAPEICDQNPSHVCYTVKTICGSNHTDMLRVPIYAISSWVSLISIKASLYMDPIRDLYEAFTIYTFFQLLINFIGGERALIIMMHGREPVHHLWPLNHFLPKVDISDPHTFLAIKRGILQYAWLKPVLGLATVIMKATGIYKEGYIGISSGYFWQGIWYNASVSLSLYALGMFWVCMHKDLQPFRPVPKFLCIKLIIFASYWQGFGLSILVWLGAIPDDVQGYTPDNLAAAIQDALICMEMPLFAFGHWYAFSWRDYADVSISAARMPVKYALRDAFGIRDLVEDTKETFTGATYEYRLFDSGDNIMAHEESSSRAARMLEGMRYERGGKGKYWIPKPGDAANARTPLLRHQSKDGNNTLAPPSPGLAGSGDASNEVDDLDPEEENLYVRAKKLEFGDWNYPVITAHTARRGGWMTDEPELLTTSANRNLLQPTRQAEQVRKKNAKKVVEKVRGKGKENESLDSGEGRAPLMKGLLSRSKSASSSKSSSSGTSDRSQLVDLVVEDTHAEEVEQVRARKEGSAGWNAVQPRRFV